MRIAIFASGNGSNFQRIAEEFPDSVVLVFSDHKNAYVLDRAKNLGIESLVFELRDFPSKVAYENTLVVALKKHSINFIVLAGYMKIIGPTLLEEFGGRIVNVHPSYLPFFAGSPHAIEESHAAKCGLGVTIHYVDEGVDTGKIIAQVDVPYANDLKSYEKQVHEAEYALYPDVIRNLIKSSK